MRILHEHIDVNAMNNVSCTLLFLMHTVSLSHVVLLQRGSTALHFAVTNNHVGTVAALLTNSTINLNMQDAEGNIALHLAALAGNAELYAMLYVRSDTSIRNQVNCSASV